MRKLDSRFGGARVRVVLLGLCAAAVLGLAGASTFGASAAPSGLVASYSFDAGTGTTAKDDSGHGNTGTITRASWTTGLHGKALSFNGVNSLVKIPDAASLDFTNGMTLEAWVKPSALSGLWRTVLLKEMPGELAYALYAKGDTSAPSGIVNTGSEQFARGKGALSTGRWAHLAATFDGTTSRLYVNGSLVSSVSAPGAILTSNGSLDIGGNSVWNEWFYGVIDDVRIYNRALSASDVAGDMSSAVTVTSTSAPTPTTTTTSTPTDTSPPSIPASPKASGATTSQISLSWSASSDNVGVAGYGVYLNGAGSGSAGSTTYTFSNLKCGTTYTLGVDAYDAAGNRSSANSVSAATAACPPSTPTDTQAPTMPATLTSTASTTTSVSLSWSASSDNVGVASYGLYRDGTGAGSSTSTSSTITGLTCGTTYSFAVDAADAAGNRSGKKTLSTSTAACPVAQSGSTSSASVFVSPSGSDSSSTCSKSSPCASFDRAYNVAAPGATVEVAGGSYPTQLINSTPKSSGPDIVFQPAAGSSVTLSNLEVTKGAHIEFRDFNVTGDTYNRPDAQYITYRRVHMGLLYIRGADHISYIDGDVGPNDSNDYMNWITEPYGSSDSADDILIDGMSFHDFTKHQAGSHVDCLGLGNSNNVVIRNSKFWDCEHFAIIPGKDPSGGVAHNLVIENNFIQCCESGYYSIGLGDAAGVTIRFNSISGAGIGWLGGTVTNTVIDSNIIDTNSSANCSQATWRYNVVASGSACGGKLAATGFKSPPTDLHLLTSAAAIGAGNPTDHPATDIDGNPRPAVPDAGASQH